jgi:hypothetical protein
MAKMASCLLSFMLLFQLPKEAPRAEAQEAETSDWKVSLRQVHGMEVTGRNELPSFDLHFLNKRTKSRGPCNTRE